MTYIMRTSRLQVADIMALVAVAALDFAAVRVAEHDGFLALGAMPMAVVLAAGLGISLRRPRSRSFVLGFEAFGVAALGSYILLASRYPGETIAPYIDYFLRLGTGWRRPGVLVPVAVVVLGLPQLVLALLGSFIFRMCWAHPAHDPPGTTP